MHAGTLDVFLLSVELSGYSNGQGFAADDEGCALGRFQFPVIQHHFIAAVAAQYGSLLVESLGRRGCRRRTARRSRDVMKWQHTFLFWLSRLTIVAHSETASGSFALAEIGQPESSDDANYILSVHF